VTGTPDPDTVPTLVQLSTRALGGLAHADA
jgi:hypothetical protein